MKKFIFVILFSFNVFGYTLNSEYIQPNSSVYLTAGNGYGSTNTKIRKYTNNTVVGTDLTYTSSAGNGDSITVNVAGTYAIERCDASTSANADVGLSLNSAQLTTNVSVITAANRLAIWEMPTITISPSNSSGQSAGCIARTRFFSVGDVIRPHDNIANTDAGVYSWLSVTRVN